MANVKIGNRVFNGIEGVVLNNQTSGNTLYSLMDWGENTAGQPNYVKNRPFWIQNKSYSWTGTDNSENSFDPPESLTTSITSKMNLISKDNFTPELMVGGSVSVNINESVSSYIINDYIATITQYQHFLAEFGGQKVIGIINGQIMGFSTSTFIGVIPVSTDTSVAIFMIAPANTFATNSPAGLYAFKFNYVINDTTTNVYYLTKLNFNDIIINESYSNFFDFLKNPIYILSTEAMTDVMNMDFSQFNKGDIIMVTTGNII